MDRAQYFEEKIAKPLCILSLKCRDDILQKRLQSRALTQLRPDDNPEAVSKRIAALHERDFTQVLDYYEQKGILVEVDASESRSDVLDSIVDGLRQHLDLLHMS